MILVTGGSGFIGSCLARELARRSQRVRVFDLVDFKERPKEIEFIKGDILHPKEIEKALKGVKTVYHAVALVPLSKAGSKFWQVNVKGTANLLKLCRKYKIPKFVYLSSSAVFGVSQCPITNDSPLKPVEPYGRSKLAAENLVKEYMREGKTTVIIRPRTALGNYRLGIFDILFEWIAENRNIYLIGQGKNLFQFIHTDDLSEAIIKAADLGKSDIFNIGTNHFDTLRKDLGEFIKRVSSKSKIKSLPASLAVPTLQVLDKLGLSPLAPWHYLTYHRPFYFDVSREMKMLDWKPKYSNVEMLVSSYRWYVNNQEKLRKVGQDKASIHHSPVSQRILKVLKWIS